MQKTLEIIEVKFVTGRPLNSEEEARLRKLINSRLGYAFDLQFTYHDELPRSASGKFEDFRSEIEA